MPLMLQDLVGMQPSPPPPPGVDPDSLMQLLQLGSVDQRHKLLEQQFDQAGQLAGGAPVDYAHGKGTPLLLASLANLVSSGVGGYQQGKATQGLRSLLDEQVAGRTSAASSMLSAKPPDLSSLLTASSADLPARTHDAQDAIAGQRRSGLMALLSGDPQLAGAGKMLYGDSDKAQETMMGLPQARQQLASGDVGLQQAIEKVRRAKTEQDAAENPATEAALRASVGKMLPGIDLSKVPGPALQHILPIAEKMFAASEAASARREVAATSAESRRDVAATNAESRKTAQQQREDSAAEKRWTQFGQELDPTKARGGEMAKVVNSLTQFGKVQQLIDQSPNPNSNQMYEMARAFDRAVSGGVATEGGTEHLIPKTALGSARDFEQWLVNSPVGRDQQAFVKQLADSIARETGYGQHLLQQWQGKKAARYSDLAKKDQGRFAAELQNWGLAPEDFDPATWVYKGGARTAPVAAPNRKTVGGKTYEKRADGWYEVTDG